MGAGYHSPIPGLVATPRVAVASPLHHHLQQICCHVSRPVGTLVPGQDGGSPAAPLRLGGLLSPNPDCPPPALPRQQLPSSNTMSQLH